jgi:hypothetical protein
VNDVVDALKRNVDPTRQLGLADIEVLEELRQELAGRSRRAVLGKPHSRVLC